MQVAPKNFLIKTAIIAFIAFPLFAQTNIPSAVSRRYVSDTVEVVGEKPKSKLGDYGSVELVTQKDFRAMPTASLPEVVGVATSGHIATHGIGQSPSLFVQGFGSDRNLILLDGEPLQFPQLGLYDLSCFPTDAVSSAELITGGASAFYGSGPIGGALDLMFDDKPPKRDYTRVSGDWGSFDRRRLSGVFKKRYSNRIGFGVTAGELRGNLHRGDGSAWNQDFSTTVWLGYENLDFRFFGSRHDGDNNTISPIDTLGNTPEPGTQEDDTRIINAKLIYRTSIADISLNYNYQDYAQVYTEPADYGGMVSEHEAQVDGGKLSAQFAENVIGDIEIAATYHKYKTKSTDSGDHSLEDYGGRLALERRLPYNISALAVVRADRDIQSQTHISPMFALKVPLGEGLEMFGSARMAYNAPTVNQLYWHTIRTYSDSFQIDDTTWMQYNSYSVMEGNPDLETEKSIGGELGLTHRQGNYFRLDIKGFYQKAEEMIQWDWEFILPDTLYYYAVNLAEATVWGVTADFSYSPDTLLRIGASYTYTDAQGKTELNDTLKPLAKVPKQQFTVFAEEPKFFMDNQLSLLMRFEAQGIFGIPDYSYEDYLDPVVILRGRMQVKFVTLSVFGMYEYALTQTEDGWKNEPYSLSPGYKTAGYLLPESQWRIGAEWEFFD